MAYINDNSDINELKVLLNKKKDLLSLILELTKEQPALIAEDTVEGLMNNIEKRQGYVDQIDGIDADIRKFKPVSQYDPDIDKTLGAIKDLLLNIKAQDEENEKAAIKRKDELQEQIKNLNAQKNKSGYDSPRMAGATYFDKLK